MAHRTAVEEASRKRGRKISPELIEELLGALVPGAIKSIVGVPGLFVGLSKAGGAKGRFPARASLEEGLESANTLAKRLTGKANINRPNTISSEGLRANVGGKRPPNTELEALALRRQTKPSSKDIDVIVTKLKELDFPIEGIIRFIASKSKGEISKMALRFRKELLASSPKPKGSE